MLITRLYGIITLTVLKALIHAFSGNGWFIHFRWPSVFFSFWVFRSNTTVLLSCTSVWCQVDPSQVNPHSASRLSLVKLEPSLVLYISGFFGALDLRSDTNFTEIECGNEAWVDTSKLIWIVNKLLHDSLQNLHVEHGGYSRPWLTHSEHSIKARHNDSLPVIHLIGHRNSCLSWIPLNFWVIWHHSFCV